jgi:pilus assembly protein CpaF
VVKPGDDPLASLLALPGVTDVLVNGPNEVWVDRGLGCERAPVVFSGPDAVRALAVRLASIAGRRLDDAAPTCDARLPDGSRLHAVLPPVADGCTAISIRRVRAEPFPLEDLVFAGMVAPELGRVLASLVAARASLLVTGGTGVGKTTLASTLLGLADPRERIVIVEEVGELNPAHPHVVRLVERRANVEGAGGVGLERLVREALRMRPDRIVLGECRGAELREVLTAYNTGHRGGLTTLHANSAADVPARLAALGSLAGLSDRATHRLAAAGFDAVVHVERLPSGVRRVAEVAVLALGARGLLVRSALTDGGARGPGWQALATLVGDA